METPNHCVFVYELSSYGFECYCCQLNFKYCTKDLLDIQTTIEYKFMLKHLREIITTYDQTHGTDKHSQHSSIMASLAK